MILIQDILVSSEVIKRKFACQLSACRGACCWEGDWGAPLDPDELEILEMIREDLRPFLTEGGNQVIDEQGTSSYYAQPKKHGTPLMPDGACAYLTFDEHDVGACGIENAYADGAVDFRKPISCQLYPLRYEEEGESFRALNYDDWDICAAACQKGQEEQMPVYRYVREAIIRRFGQAFFDTLDEVARDLPDAHQPEPGFD